MKKLYIFASSLILTLFASCDKENIVFNDFKDITFEEWPRTDCSTSTRPVSIVSPMNPVKNLTVEQVQKIYTGEITNWKEVGGEDHAITPYIRDADSGSQEKMETMVMKGLSMIDGKNMPEIIGSQMASPYWQIEHDEYGIGYTPFFYCTAMVRDLLKVDMLSINGVMPSKETLRNGSYPFISSIYAAKRESEEPNSKAYKFYDFLFTKSGANMIDESGYIAIR